MYRFLLVFFLIVSFSLQAEAKKKVDICRENLLPYMADSFGHHLLSEINATKDVQLVYSDFRFKPYDPVKWVAFKKLLDNKVLERNNTKVQQAIYSGLIWSKDRKIKENMYTYLDLDKLKDPPFSYRKYVMMKSNSMFGEKEIEKYYKKLKKCAARKQCGLSKQGKKVDSYYRLLNTVFFEEYGSIPTRMCPLNYAKSCSSTIELQKRMKSVTPEELFCWGVTFGITGSSSAKKKYYVLNKLVGFSNLMYVAAIKSKRSLWKNKTKSAYILYYDEGEAYISDFAKYSYTAADEKYKSSNIFSAWGYCSELLDQLIVSKYRPVDAVRYGVKCKALLNRVAGPIMQHFMQKEDSLDAGYIFQKNSLYIRTMIKSTD